MKFLFQWFLLAFKILKGLNKCKHMVIVCKLNFSWRKKSTFWNNDSHRILLLLHIKLNHLIIWTKGFRIFRLIWGNNESHREFFSSSLLTLISSLVNSALNMLHSNFCSFFFFFPVRNLSLKLAKDIDQEARCSHIRGVPSSPSSDWPLPSVEENGGIDSLPFRLMLQDCTAVKTLLLKMKRVLQEVMVCCKINVFTAGK